MLLRLVMVIVCEMVVQCGADGGGGGGDSCFYCLTFKEWVRI